VAEVFHIVPAASRSMVSWIPVVALVLVVLTGVIALLAVTMRASRTATFEVSAEGLRLRGDLYGRKLAASKLRGGAARIVDVDRDPGLRPRSRTAGTALPGYRAGWFRLANGEKALLYLTDPHRAVYVPTREGYSLLLSVDRPEEFVGRLRAIAPAA
jgi:hypothetical protein